MATTTKNENNLNSSLSELSEIADWFEQQQEVDVEKGLEKVKRASEIIKASKKRLGDIENQFKEIKAEIDSEIGDDEEIQSIPSQDAGADEEMNVEDIPF